MNTMNVCRMLEPHLPDRAIELYKQAADVYNVSLQNSALDISLMIERCNFNSVLTYQCSDYLRKF